MWSSFISSLISLWCEANMIHMHSLECVSSLLHSWIRPRCRMPIKELGTPRTMNVFFPSLHPLYLSFSWATITTCVFHLPSHHSFPSYTLQINILVCATKGWSCQGWWFDTLQMAFLRLWPHPFLWNVRFDFARTNVGSYIVDFFLWFQK